MNISELLEVYKNEIIKQYINQQNTHNDNNNHEE